MVDLFTLLDLPHLLFMFTATGELGILSITSSAGRIRGLQTWCRPGTDPAR